MLQASGDGAQVRDELTGDLHTIRAKVVVNATGVWAGDLVPEVRLRPSRGTHLVVRSASLGAGNAVVNAAIPDTMGRFVFTLPQPDGLTYLGLTDEPVEGHPDDVPEPGNHDIDFLLDTINSVLEHDLQRSDVVGMYAGLRPLIDADGSSADLSRRHAVLTSSEGVVTIVGGKLTTYRRMAQDTVDHIVRDHDLTAGPCVTAELPLVGAADRANLRSVPAPARLVRRYGTEAPIVAAGMGPEMLAPIADTVPTTPAELHFAVTHEGALDVDDLLDRRTRIGLVPADRDRAVAAAQDVLTRLHRT
ncbi:glycerol-3-phosphate dehydrogenase/oxidase [Leekyejoonella antrihumi]|uniref:glycerol-3-phosphate dehydrogenase/oxidase n=1 Tax=Leekyejoonella antrihumi TaxID=1660198 RepID=UPI00248217F5|nr:FAD-dependent oxidoreductase [Leekyejoonella antrihumi]